MYQLLSQGGPAYSQLSQQYPPAGAAAAAATTAVGGGYLKQAANVPPVTTASTAGGKCGWDELAMAGCPGKGWWSVGFTSFPLASVVHED